MWCQTPQAPAHVGRGVRHLRCQTPVRGEGRLLRRSQRSQQPWRLPSGSLDRRKTGLRPPTEAAGPEERAEHRRPRRRARGLMATTASHRIGRDEVVWSFGPDMEPVLEVEPGSVVTLETNDCFTGQIQSETDLVTEI